MSQHNISGSEVFGPKPYVTLRSVKAGAFRKRRAVRAWVAFIAGVAAAVAVGAVAVTAIVGPETIANLI